MKLYTSVGPNPRIVGMFMAEKQMVIPRHWVDLVAGENRRQPFLSISAAGQLPVLELASGRCIAETIAICEYLEDIQADPALIGTMAEDRALVRMWTRHVELLYAQPLGAYFRFGPALPLFQSRMTCIPQAADGMAQAAREGTNWLEAQMADKTFVTGDRFSMADIVLFCFADFAAQRAGVPLTSDHPKLGRWFARVAERTSAQSTAAEAYGARPA